VAVAPAGWVAAQFSHPHSVAMALLGVRPGADWYAAATMARADVRALRARVRVMADPASERLDGCLEDGHFTRLPAGVELRVSGRRLAADANRAMGDPWRETTRLRDEDLVAKLATMTGTARSGSAEALGPAVLDLAGAPGVGAIGAALRALDGTDLTGPVAAP
jgi:2-methylcitrate dehydratase PrpD